jgi:hypothetical protein
MMFVFQIAEENVRTLSTYAIKSYSDYNTHYIDVHCDWVCPELLDISCPHCAHAECLAVSAYFIKCVDCWNLWTRDEVVKYNA